MKKFLLNQFFRSKRFSKLFAKYCGVNNLLPSVMTASDSARLRDYLFLPASEHRAQLNQDVFALLVNRFRPGFFLEIGANDGFTLSNTVYLEEQFGWNGILVEANPKYIPSLARRKKAIVVNKAISDSEGHADFVDGGLYGGLAEKLDSRHARFTDEAEKITVPCITVSKLFGDVSAPKVIDFVSVDVEGGELQILPSLLESGHRFRCGCVEMNYRVSDIARVKDLLAAHGYAPVWEGQSAQDLYFVDPALCGH